MVRESAPERPAMRAPGGVGWRPHLLGHGQGARLRAQSEWLSLAGGAMRGLPSLGHLLSECGSFPANAAAVPGDEWQLGAAWGPPRFTVAPVNAAPEPSMHPC
jgi:hypothetical protein